MQHFYLIKCRFKQLYGMAFKQERRFFLFYTTNE